MQRGCRCRAQAVLLHEKNGAGQVVENIFNSAYDRVKNGAERLSVDDHFQKRGMAAPQRFLPLGSGDISGNPCDTNDFAQLVAHGDACSRKPAHLPVLGAHALFGLIDPDTRRQDTLVNLVQPPRHIVGRHIIDRQPAAANMIWRMTE